MTTRDHRLLSLVVDNARKSIRAWQDQVRDSSLTTLLVMELCAIFLATPLAAKGLPLARVLADALVLAILVIVVLLSHRPGPIVLILLGLATIGASLLLRGELSGLATRSRSILVRARASRPAPLELIVVGIARDMRAKDAFAAVAANAN